MTFFLLNSVADFDLVTNSRRVDYIAFLSATTPKCHPLMFIMLYYFLSLFIYRIRNSLTSTQHKEILRNNFLIVFRTLCVSYHIPLFLFLTLSSHVNPHIKYKSLLLTRFVTHCRHTAHVLLHHCASSPPRQLDDALENVYFRNALILF